MNLTPPRRIGNVARHEHPSFSAWWSEQPRLARPARAGSRRQASGRVAHERVREARKKHTLIHAKRGSALVCQFRDQRPTRGAHIPCGCSRFRLAPSFGLRLCWARQSLSLGRKEMIGLLEACAKRVNRSDRCEVGTQVRGCYYDR